jgi:hypothetical protein
MSKFYYVSGPARANWAARLVLASVVLIASCYGLFFYHAIRDIHFGPPLGGKSSSLPCLCRASHGQCACALGLSTTGEAPR